jgi:hypothetical protein
MILPAFLTGLSIYALHYHSDQYYPVFITYARCQGHQECSSEAADVSNFEYIVEVF